MANAEAWGRARLIAYWSVAPHTKKSKKLKLTDIMDIPLLDNSATPKSITVAKAYRLSPEEIELWHADKWIPPDERTEQ